jgi:hypothetical protein
MQVRDDHGCLSTEAAGLLSRREWEGVSNASVQVRTEARQRGGEGTLGGMNWANP